MLLYWPKPLYPYYRLLLFSLSLISVYRLVLWSWGLWTDRVYITLSLALPTFFNNNNNKSGPLLVLYNFTSNDGDDAISS